MTKCSSAAVALAIMLGSLCSAQNGRPVMTEIAAARFLDQATWGPTPASITALQQTGIENWLTAQFALKTSDLPDQPILDPQGKNNGNLQPVQSAFFQNALTGADQLRQRVAFILSQIWVVSAVDVNSAYAFPPYWRIFRDNAFGNYRDIIKAVSLSPAMGHYLNMANNNKGNAAKGTAANENYGRELMQLFTLGLSELTMDGAPITGINHTPIPTYTQAEVTSIAKALTGWTYPTAPGATAHSNNPPYFFGQMIPVEANHDTSAKTIFHNIQIPAGQTAEQDLDSVINALMDQMTMAPFVSQQLIEHLVTSNPSPAYIQRVAQVFFNNGHGIHGDLKAVITAILTDPEARAGDYLNASGQANFGHLREPVLFMANVLRGLNATLGPSSAIYNQTNQLGQNLFYSPSVFSYFSPQSRTEKGLYGPEFQIYSTQTAADRADIINTLIYGTLDKSTKLDLTPFMNLQNSVPQLVDYISLVFLHHNMLKELQDAVTTAANAATTPQRKVQAALYIALTSSEYEVIH